MIYFILEFLLIIYLINVIKIYKQHYIINKEKNYDYQNETMNFLNLE